MGKRKGRASSSSSRPPHSISLDDDNPIHPNPNPEMKETDDDAKQIENPQNPISIIDSQEEIPKNVSEDVKDETFKVVDEPQLGIPVKRESFNGEQPLEVEPENLPNRRANKRRKNNKPTINIVEEEEGPKDGVVDVIDSLDKTANSVVKEEQMPTSPNDEIHNKVADLEADSEPEEDDEQEEETHQQGMNAKQTSKKSNKNIKKKKPLTAKKKAALDKKLELAKKKLELLEKNLLAIPFVPEKKFDFYKHGKLFRRLGLWDFVHIEFDANLRLDLIALLVANYDHDSKSSNVNGCRIKVSRADLARALMLPVKKDRSVVLETIADFSSEALSDEVVLFIEEFVCNWVLLHEDTWILPKEVMTMTTLIKNRQLHKIDWPGLVWFMVKKELRAAPEVGTLYYASHLQCLMKSQREDLFEEEAVQEDPMDDREVGVDLKMGSSNDNQKQQIDKQQSDMCLGLSKNENGQQDKDTDTMQYQDCAQESSDQAEGPMEDKRETSDLSLRCFNFNDAQILESQDTVKEEAGDNDNYDQQSEEGNLEALVSPDLQGIGATNITLGHSLRYPGSSSGHIFHSGNDMNVNMGGTSMFPNTLRRENSHDNFIDDDHSMNNHHKQMRDNGSSSEFHFMMEQINCMTKRATMMYAEKAQAPLISRVNEHQVLELQQQNEHLNYNIQNTQWENLQKDKEIYRLEHELNLMVSLLAGYRKCLEVNRRAFLEYRQCDPKPEEPLYKDIGSGGLVLSTVEIERQCTIIKHMVEKFEADCFEMLKACANAVSRLNDRLLGIKETILPLKEKHAKSGD